MGDSGLSHLGDDGRPRMVDVSGKDVTVRTARAEARVVVGAELAAILRDSGRVAKGPVFDTARLAGIQAAKRTGEWIPLCHPLPLDGVDVDCRMDGDDVVVESRVTTTARTGVEMEALTAVTAAALTVYDMCKAVTKGIEIQAVRLLEKTGGKSGDWRK